MDNFSNLDDSVYIEETNGAIIIHNLENVSIKAQKEKMDKNVFGYYQNIKSMLISNGKIQNRTYLGKECFYAKEEMIAKFNIINGKLHLYLKLSPKDRGAQRLFKRPKHIIDTNNEFTLVMVNSENEYNRALELVSFLLHKYSN
ncbi:MAG: hypothetical protein GX242_02735 [Clostridiales bacterium]|nr:hypothetical protein [Clostridiales bacterium]